MPLNLQAKGFLDQLASAQAPDMSTLDPEQARPMYEAMRSPEPGESVARLRGYRLASREREIGLRVYTPVGPGPHPAIVYYHGGGWVIGSLETHDHLCRALTNRCGSVVISVDYRLAPEHPFPAAPNDSYTALRAVIDNAQELGVDPERISVAGDSAGGNLAAVVSLMARDRGGPLPRAQVLIYPATDRPTTTASYRENGEGYLLTRASMEWFWGHYLTGDAGAGANPLASPARAASLRGLPPALIITAEFDPLRDEGEAYAERLREAGVPTRCSRYDGAIHDFVRASFLMDQGKEAIEEIAAFLAAPADVVELGRS